MYYKSRTIEKLLKLSQMHTPANQKSIVAWASIKNRQQVAFNSAS